MLPIFSRLINSCWFLFRGVAILAVVGVGVGIWFYLTRFDEAIRSNVQARLEKSYPNLSVTVRAAQRVEGEGILVRGISLSEREADGPLAELIHIDELLLRCSTDLPDLLGSDLPISELRLRRPTLRATRRPNGSWSVAQLLPLPRSGCKPPVVTIEDGTVELFDPQAERSSGYAVRQVNVTIRPHVEGASGGRELPVTVAAIGGPMPITQAQGGGGAPGAVAAGTQPSGVASPPAAEFSGSFTGDFLRRIEFQGRFDPATTCATLGGRAEKIEIGPDLMTALPSAVALRFGPLASLRGQVDLTFRADLDPARPEPWNFTVDGELSRGKIEDPRVPLPISDLAGRIHADNKGYRVEQATARSGLTTLTLSGHGDGFTAESPVSLRAEARRFFLDRQLAAKLPLEWQGVWYKFLPAGEIQWKLALNFDGKKWAPQMDVECVDVSFTHHKFPYRVERAAGTMNLVNDQLVFRLRGFGDDRPIDIEGQIDHPGPASTGTVTISTTQLPLSAKLLDALPGKSQAIVRSLQPQGTINSAVRLWRATPEEKWHHQVGVELNRISLKYQKFAYPLADVRGFLDGVDGQWRFRDLVGINSNGVVTCNGSYTQQSPDAGELLMRFDGKGIAMNDDLKGALPPAMQALWTKLKPVGLVDLSSLLRFASPEKKLELSVHVDAGGEGLVIEPEFFPYRMEKLRGSLDYQNGQTAFRGLTAEHNRTKLSTDGNCVLAQDGSWNLRLENLAVDQLASDGDFVAALPAGLRKRIMELNLEGSLAMRGMLAFRRGGQPTEPLTAAWDLEFTALKGQLRCGVELKNIAGGVRLAGEFDGVKQQSRGLIDLDSVSYGPYQLTEVRGPFRIGDDQFLLGAVAEEQRPGQAPRHLTARLYGGAAAADVRVTTTGTPQFSLAAGFDGCDLTRFLTETMPTRTQLRGTVAGTIELTGSAAGTHRLQGGGAMWLRDGDIYELPLLLSLLKILSVRAPDKKAFSSSDASFKIRGDHVYFDSINFYGDAISLRGEGEMDFAKNVRMTFHPIIGSQQAQQQIPILRPLLGMAGQQLMLLKVDGSLENPHVTREALPAVRETIDQIQGKNEESAKSFPLLRSAGQMLESLVPGK